MICTRKGGGGGGLAWFLICRCRIDGGATLLRRWDEYGLGVEGNYYWLNIPRYNVYASIIDHERWCKRVVKAELHSLYIAVRPWFSEMNIHGLICSAKFTRSKCWEIIFFRHEKINQIIYQIFAESCTHSQKSALQGCYEKGKKARN